MQNSVRYASEYFTQKNVTADMPYFVLGARPCNAGSAGLDSSDQLVLSFDEVSGIGAYRSAIMLADANNNLTHTAVQPTRLVFSFPSLDSDGGQRLASTLAQIQYLDSDCINPLPAQYAYVPPRLTTSIMRELADYQLTRSFLNSIYCRPGLIFLRDGRLNAQRLPGAAAYDSIYRLAVTRGVHTVGIAKTSRLLSEIRPLVRQIRAEVGTHPFAIPISGAYLRRQVQRSGKGFLSSLTHGKGANALGGAGGIRFVLSLSSNNVLLVEFNLYELAAFRDLVLSGKTLEEWGRQWTKNRRGQIYSWDILPFVQYQDFDELFLPVLEMLVFSSYANDNIGIYPFVLSEAHNRVKLRWAELEPLRNNLLSEFRRHTDIPVDFTGIPEDPHKFDPEIVNRKRF